MDRSSATAVVVSFRRWHRANAAALTSRSQSSHMSASSSAPGCSGWPRPDGSGIRVKMVSKRSRAIHSPYRPENWSCGGDSRCRRRAPSRALAGDKEFVAAERHVHRLAAHLDRRLLAEGWIDQAHGVAVEAADGKQAVVGRVARDLRRLGHVLRARSPRSPGRVRSRSETVPTARRRPRSRCGRRPKWQCRRAGAGS
jgi:hypothetical protein